MGHARMRVIFYGEPLDPDEQEKTFPDYESAGAVWVSASELPRLPLRGDEPTAWISYLESGKPIYPLSVLSREWDPVV
jgi:hypothetical protein